MSVSDLATAVDRVRAALPPPALREADGCLEEAANVLAIVSTGSTATELVEAAEGLLRAREKLAAAQQACSALGEVLGQYLAGIGVGSPEAGSSSTIRPLPSAPSPKPTSTSDPALIAEVQRQGHKISPERVVRIARLPDKRIVWLEEGDERRGLQHIFRNHEEDFADCGIPKDRIIDHIFEALTQGEEIGYTATDRKVYEVRNESGTRRVAISIGKNGFIVGANPMSLKGRVKQWKKQ